MRRQTGGLAERDKCAYLARWLRLVFLAFVATVYNGHADLLSAEPASSHTSSVPHLAAATPTEDCAGFDSDAHSIGNIAVGIEGFGIIGIGSDPCRQGLLTRVEFPNGSRNVYIGPSLWIGGIRGGDTLVSGGSSIHSSGLTEFFPTACEVEHKVNARLISRVCLSEFISDSTVSDEDLVARYSDTTTNPLLIGNRPIEGRSHIPLGIEVEQRSFAWSSGSASDFVIIEFELTNIGVASEPEWSGDLKDVFLGFFGVPLIMNNPPSFFFDGDNMVEFIGAAKSPLRPEILEQFDVMLAFDNDGDPSSFGFDRTSVPDVVGIVVLKSPSTNARVNFNWWTPNTDPSLDWGPVRVHSKVEFLRGGLGSPDGDRAAYQMMSNGERDYPPFESALGHEAAGWLPPHANSEFAATVASGIRVDYLLSVGPFDIPFGSSKTVAVAIVGGTDLHFDPANYRDFFEPARPELYRSRLDVTDLLRNAQWAKWTYDNPGVDTDRDGYAGEWFLRGNDTVYFRGDGVPDIRAALPPASPRLKFKTRTGQITATWNGRQSELEEDLFTQRRDFEGYRVYMSRTGRNEEWLFLDQRDLLNYTRFTWDRTSGKWQTLDPPFALDSLRSLYDDLVNATYGWPAFHPDSFKTPIVEDALLEVIFDPANPQILDSVYSYFAGFGANNQPDDIGLARASEAGLDVTGVIRKLHPESLPDDTMFREDGTPFLPFLEYEYVLKDIQIAEPVFLAVTAFDHGDPGSGLEPLESSRANNAQEIWPVNDAETVKSERPRPGVYPNPYRIIDAYFDNGWENRLGLEPDRQRARQVTFYNVPDTCVLSIWSLDGDLVRKLNHAEHPSSSEATVVRWNLITRNTQAVKTGIYIYSVESRFGTDVGKLVIIK